MNERQIKLDDVMPLMLEQLNAGHSVTFSPHGISMLPMLREGKDTVTLAPLNGKLKKYDLPLYRRDDGKYVLHRVIKVGETYTCVGDNQFAYEKGLTHGQMIAVVAAFTRGEKQYSSDDLSYRIYCRLWHYSRLPRRILRGVGRRLIKAFKG